jgi:glycosyltransferase involved in cell wall biosynthesis
MKILMLVFNQVDQGTYWRAFHFARTLIKHGHQVTLLATSRSKRTGIISRYKDGVEVVEMPDLFRGMLRSGWDLWNTVNRIFWLRGRKFDIVHAFESRPTVIFPALFIHHQGIPLIMDWADWFGRGGSVEERTNPIVRFILRPIETFFETHFRTRADGTTVICSLLREKAISLGVLPETICSIRNGVDLNSRQPMDTETARIITGLPEAAPIIGYIGTIFPRDAKLLVDSFEVVLQEFKDTHLVIAGYCPFDIRSIVSKPERVVQTGFIDNLQINQYLSACNLFWLPLGNRNANRGRLPYKLTDYMAMGRPIVATSIGDIPEIFSMGKIGLLAADNADSFAGCTLSLLRNPSKAKKMGQNARLLAESSFSWELITVDLERFYQNVVTRIKV